MNARLFTEGLEISRSTWIGVLRQVGSDLGSAMAVLQALWWGIKHASSRPDLSDLQGSYTGWVKNQPGHDDYGINLTISASTLLGRTTYAVRGESYKRGELVVEKVIRSGPGDSSLQMLFKYTRYKHARGVILMRISANGEKLAGCFAAWGALDDGRPTYGQVEFTSIRARLESAPGVATSRTS